MTPEPSPDIDGVFPAADPSGTVLGAAIGHYTISGLLGEGGMGRVYRARDGKLGREVAIKILPSQFATDPERVTRFTREARVLASLNHPNIAAIHGVEETNGVRAIVMELVDGETLADRIARGPVPLPQTLAFARQIAGALDSAHQKGIVHRDLKPANMTITPDGVIKVLDFGIAKAVGDDGAGADVTHSPTVTVSGTRDGGVLGTAAYMSPEQSRGLAVDKRADIWAFGCVLYEMLTGRPAFGRATTTDTLAAIVTSEPDWTVLPRDLAPEIRTLLARCLEKDPQRRLRDIGDARSELEMHGAHSSHVRSDRSTKGSSILRRWRRTAAVVSGIAVVGTLLWFTNVRGNFVAAPGVRSLAVLPLKPLQSNTADDYLGLGLADTIITRIAQVEGLTVRPTNAVRRFAKGDTDPLQAASSLQVDAVLDGTLQRSGDQLRINVSLFRVRDGAALWSRTFNVDFKDVFTVEDAIAENVVSQLRLQLSAAERLRLTRHQTASPEAYEYYLKGIATFGTQGAASPTVIGDVENGARMLEQAVSIDPNYALAYAQLASAYAEIGLLSTSASTSGPMWIDRARAALARADALDNTLAESHIVRHKLLRSPYANYQNLPAYQELRTAQAINPNVAHYELGGFLAELGLLEPALRELRRAIELDPTNESARAEIPNAYWYSARYDEAIEENLKLRRSVAWAFFYYLGAGRLAEAEKMIDESAVRNPADARVQSGRAWLLAARGQHREAQALLSPLTDVARRNLTYHHAAYLRACIYALGNDAVTAVHWLQETVDTGMPVYPAFSRDKCFDRIRPTPQFMKFMADLKPVWQGYERRMR